MTVQRGRDAISLYSRFAQIRTVSDVTSENIRTFFFQGRTQRQWKTSTFLTYRKALLVFFKWCVKEGHIEKNPVEDIEKPKREKLLPTHLTTQAALKLLEVVYNYPYTQKFLRYRNHAMFSMFLFAGLRKGELLNLKLTDVDLENLTVFVRQGKGAKDRIIPMSYALAHSLKRYVEERKRHHKTCPEFFTSSNKNMGFTENGLTHFVTELRASTGLKFHIHQLRHTFATLMLEGGCDIYSLSKMMGHSDISTTTIYLSASAEHLRNQMFKHPLNDLVR